MNATREKLQMWLVRESRAAVLVCDSASGESGLELWLPRSLIDRALITRAAQPDHRASIEFTLPEWKVEQAKLWDFVTA